MCLLGAGQCGGGGCGLDGGVVKVKGVVEVEEVAEVKVDVVVVVVRGRSHGPKIFCDQRTRTKGPGPKDQDQRTRTKGPGPKD